jgi:hypothetical protein
MTSLKWSKRITKQKKQSCRRHHIDGVEVRDLDKNHLLYGQQGLFATKFFKKFDILGEYVGEIVDINISGEYVASLEDKDISFGVDAGNCGNEMRFINCNFGIREEPNVKMQRVYIDTYPHILIICLEDININEEFLLYYGKEYIDEFILKINGHKNDDKKIKEEAPFHLSMFVDELPGFEDDKDDPKDDRDNDASKD